MIMALRPKSAQDILNDLIYLYGSNFPEWFNYPEVLKTFGLFPTDITKEMLDEADFNARLRCRAEIRGANPPESNTISAEYEHDSLTQSEESTMKVSLADVQNLGTAMGKPAAKDWTVKRAQERVGSLEALHALMEDSTTLAKGSKELKLLNEISQAHLDGNGVEVVEDEEKAHEGNGKPPRKVSGEPRRSSKAKVERKTKAEKAPKAAKPAKTAHKVKMPQVGETLTKEFKGKEIKVTVLEDGFKMGTKKFPSLTAAARHACGYRISGLSFFKLK